MTPMNGQEEPESNADIELFEAISHPTRVKMLYTLKEESLGFAELKKIAGVSSSGNLQHHIRKLTSLIGTNSSGEYILTDQGREAIVAINAVRNLQNRHREDSKLVTFVTTLGFYITYFNIQFISNPSNIFLPLQSIAAAIAYALFFYLFYSWRLRTRVNGI